MTKTAHRYTLFEYNLPVSKLKLSSLQSLIAQSAMGLSFHILCYTAGVFFMCLCVYQKIVVSLQR